LAANTATKMTSDVFGGVTSLYFVLYLQAFINTRQLTTSDCPGTLKCYRKSERSLFWKE